ACCLPYLVFDDWSYVRFLLPTIPLLMILVMACLDSICRRLAPWTARPVVALAAVVLVVLYLREAQVRHVFQL
ncbi:MAG: hypothetical protein HY824_13135, partial [Acidobacteria bacterium]|nr:hypothetical protein [Acidobacteriota bacterium]